MIEGNEIMRKQIVLQSSKGLFKSKMHQNIACKFTHLFHKNSSFRVQCPFDAWLVKSSIIDVLKESSTECGRANIQNLSNYRENEFLGRERDAVLLVLTRLQIFFI